MQPRPIAETIGPPRPSFRCFILFQIRLSVLSQLRNPRAAALQSFSIRQCEDDEIQASMHATFGAENFLQTAAHTFCRQVLDGRDDEGAPESDESVRCVAGIRSRWRNRSIGQRDTQFWLGVPAR